MSTATKRGGTMKITTTGGIMHSHDRTMVAKLGFADPDKRDDRHELACQFLVQPDVAGGVGAMEQPELIRSSGAEGYPPRAGCDSPSCRGRDVYWDREFVQQHVAMEFDGVRLVRGVTELAISKGEGPYRTTVGFCDVHLEFDYVYRVLEAGPPSPAASECVHCDRPAVVSPGY